MFRQGETEDESVVWCVCVCVCVCVCAPVMCCVLGVSTGSHIPKCLGDHTLAWSCSTNDATTQDFHKLIHMPEIPLWDRRAPNIIKEDKQVIKPIKEVPLSKLSLF